MENIEQNNSSTVIPIKESVGDDFIEKVEIVMNKEEKAKDVMYEQKTNLEKEELVVMTIPETLTIETVVQYKEESTTQVS